MRRRSASGQPSWGSFLSALVLAVTFLASLGFAGCAGLTSSPTAKSSGGGGTPASGSPIVSVAPSPVSFGSVAAGSSGTQTVTVSNPGTAALTITQAVTSGTGFSISGLSLPLSVPVGQSSTFTASFQPASPGSFSGSISITSNASSSALVVSLSGTGLASGGSHSVALSWAASTSTGIAGYNVYRGTVANGPYSKITSSLVAGTQYTDGTVTSGQTYYYVVTAVDSSNAESPYSNQTLAAIP